MANHISYIEIFYLTFRFSPVYATIFYENNELKVVRHNTISAFLTSAFGITKSTEKGESLSSIMKYAKDNHLGPVVLFPEGTATNGRALLRFQPVFPSDFESFLKKENLHIHLVGLRFEYRHFSPGFHFGSFYYHLFLLLNQFNNRLCVG